MSLSWGAVSILHETLLCTQVPCIARCLPAFLAKRQPYSALPLWQSKINTSVYFQQPEGDWNKHFSSPFNKWVHWGPDMGMWQDFQGHTRLRNDFEAACFDHPILVIFILLNPSLIAAAAAAKSLQSCPTLCDPIDSSPPGSPIPGILQAKTLEWVASSFSNA